MLEEIITKFVLNPILHNVGISWIIFSNEEMKYEIDKSNHPDWLNKGTWYNIDICSELYGKLFEDCISHKRTYRYYLMCSIVAHKKKRSYEDEDEERSIRDMKIPKKTTIEAL